MLKNIFMALFVFVVVTLTGCSLFQSHQGLATVGVQYVVMKTINNSSNPKDMAERARLVVDYANTLVEGDIQSMQDLDTAIRARIHWDKYDPADRLLISTALNAAEQDIAAVVGPDGKINQETKAKVKVILKDIRQAIDMSGY